jgi:hypothetical protein
MGKACSSDTETRLSCTDLMGKPIVNWPYKVSRRIWNNNINTDFR